MAEKGLQREKEALASTSTSTEIASFFTRNHFTPQDIQECYLLISKLYPNNIFRPVPNQGHCSLTFIVGDKLVVQVRPPNYKLDLSITTLASKLYPSYAPTTNLVTTLPSSGLLIYNMTVTPGISLQNIRIRSPRIASSFVTLKNLCMSFAQFLAKSWNTPHQVSPPLRQIGLSLYTRLLNLHQHLPPRFRTLTSRLLVNFHSTTSLPWILQHGDLLPGNVMLSPSSGHLTGLVDWTESEILPFGVCIYGVEEILGELTSTGFSYHPESDRLRHLFWDELKKGIPELEDEQMRSRVEMARDFGVLLWYGIAWDDGAIDRVVEEGKDIIEIWKLDAFLNSGRCENAGEEIMGGERESKL